MPLVLSPGSIRMEQPKHSATMWPSGGQLRDSFGKELPDNRRWNNSPIPWRLHSYLEVIHSNYCLPLRNQRPTEVVQWGAGLPDPAYCESQEKKKPVDRRKSVDSLAGREEAR